MIRREGLRYDLDRCIADLHDRRLGKDRLSQGQSVNGVLGVFVGDQQKAKFEDDRRRG
jgi:hypothetical protein